MSAEPVPATFLFADLAGFTALTEAHGDEEAADLVADFVSCTRELLEGSGVEEVKGIGDALLLRTEDAGDAVRLALRLSQEIEGRAGFPGIRIGMHTGAAVERGGDWFGSAVNVAARVAGLATSGDVLLTEATREAAGELEDIELQRAGKRQLRNVSEPVILFAAVPAGPRSDEGLPIDPVCRMAVEPGHAAGALAHEGRTYHFCSLDCAAQFARDPERFTA